MAGFLNFAFMERFLALIQNKYLIAGVAFFIWMCFFDRYDFSTQFAYQQEKNKLEREREFYESEITRIEQAIKDVQYSPREIQRIARERYKMKKDNEDIYVIQQVEPKQ
ncbi:FtsB family cell division protein [Sphingobacterium micropteri]|nr:septum formation initiator family protein [Sphingobacterium micropteri]